jgi:hypothetical protein
MRSVWRGVVGIAALFLATVVSGQQLATLNAGVTDQSGGAIPKAQIHDSKRRNRCETE